MGDRAGSAATDKTTTDKTTADKTTTDEAMRRTGWR